jgi:hypothetical protein
MSTETIWLLPHKSQEFNEGPRARFELGQLTLAYDYETEDGSYRWEEVSFSGVAAFAFTGAAYCSEDQVAAYDKLEEVTDSPWRGGLRGLSDDVRHYRIYFDDAGCYEVLAAAFVPPQPGRP